MLEHISAEVIAKSKNFLTSDTLVTFLLTYPRIIHAEILTHRVFSRNCASSRAVPVPKQIHKLESEYFIPDQWVANCKGMSPSAEIPEQNIDPAIAVWNRAKQEAVIASAELYELGVHKEISNRLTEPFQIMQTVLTVSNSENFYRLRLSETAQRQIRALALAMYEANEAAEPEVLRAGEWHLPFLSPTEKKIYNLQTLIALSIARCARVSYYLVDGTPSNIEKDIALGQKLIKDHHLSPCEHSAMAFSRHVKIGNFVGFMQFRKFLKEETYDRDQNVPVLNTEQALTALAKDPFLQSNHFLVNYLI
jgi:thymidylate synthase ThyX